MRFLFMSWLVLVGVVWTTSAHAVTAAGITGRVVNEAAAPVGSAQVAVLHQPTGTRRETVTDADGRFSLRGLRVGGPYRVEVVAEGYQSRVLENQTLDLKESTHLQVSLLAAQAAEEVVVTASRLGGTFDSGRTGIGTTVDRDSIESLPSIQRNIQDFIRTDPRISQVDKQRGEISAGGQNTRYNNIRIDGVSTNDAFGLESNNLPTARQPISLDAVESINIALTDFDVARSGYTGASVDAVTRSGTNEIDGSAYYLTRQSDWTGKRNGQRFAGFDEEGTFGATLGAPIIEDRLFVFLAYEKFERNALAPTFGPAGSGAPQIVTGISSANVEEVRQIARDIWKFDAGSFSPPGSLDTEIEDLLVKLDWNISDAHRATLRYNKTEQIEPFLRNIGSRELSLSSYWHENIKEYESLVAHLYSDWTDRISTEFSLSRAEQASNWDIGTPLPTVRICLNSTSCSGADSIWLGSERFRHVNILETETLSFFGAATLFLDEHELKFGLEYETRDIFNLFGRDQFGYYEFFGINAFRTGRPNVYNLFYPTQGDVNTRAAEWTLGNWAFFAQDTWTFSPELNVTFGLRYDRPVANDKPAFNQAASTFFGIDNNSTVDGNGLLQPRLSFNWQPAWFDRQTQLRGGVGLFQGIAANVWLSNPYTNNNVIQGAIFNNNPAASGIVFSPDPFNQPGQRPPPGLGGNVDFVDPDTKLPSVWKIALAVDHELPWLGMVASVEVLQTEVEKGIYYVKPNLGAPTGFAQDGRPYYWVNARPGSNFGAAGTTANRNRDFGVDSTIAQSTGKGGGTQVTFSLQGPPDSEWYWNVAYTRTSADEVNPLTSSQAASNWNNAVRADGNADEAERSIYAIRDRINFTLSWRHAFFGDYLTTFGLFYEGRSGRPFTYVFVNDANGDGRSGVDPLYVPRGPGDVLFTGGAAMEAEFLAYIAGEDDLRGQLGEIAGINRARSPWVNQVDIRLAQQIPGLWDGRGEIWLDILNVGNLINNKWGRIEEVGFPYGYGVVRFAGVDPASGKYVYDFRPSDLRDRTLRDDIGESRWAMQVGLRYSF
jgi:outer membrane receptor protein involved in Fe transport